MFGWNCEKKISELLQNWMSCFDANVVKFGSDANAECNDGKKVVQCMISGSSEPRFCCGSSREEDVQYTHSTVHASNYSRILANDTTS